MSEEKREDGMNDFMRGLLEEFSQKPGASKKDSSCMVNIRLSRWPVLTMNRPLNSSV